jgi:hypothetical protein
MGGMGRGGRGQRLHGPGTITPCAEALMAAKNNVRNKTEMDGSIRRFETFMISSISQANLTQLVSG